MQNKLLNLLIVFIMFSTPVLAKSDYVYIEVLPDSTTHQEKNFNPNLYERQKTKEQKRIQKEKESRIRAKERKEKVELTKQRLRETFKKQQ